MLRIFHVWKRFQKVTRVQPLVSADWNAEKGIVLISRYNPIDVLTTKPLIEQLTKHVNPPLSLCIGRFMEYHSTAHVDLTELNEFSMHDDI